MTVSRGRNTSQAPTGRVDILRALLVPLRFTDLHQGVLTKRTPPSPAGARGSTVCALRAADRQC